MIELYEKRMNRLHSALDDEGRDPSNLSLVGHLADENLQAVISGVLDCQRADNSNPDHPEFVKLISLPASVHAMASLPHDLFSLQPTSKEDDLLFFFEKAGDPKSIRGVQRHCIVRPTLNINDLSQIPDEEIVRHLLDMACAVCEEATVSLLKEMVKPNKYNKNLRTSADLLDTIYEMSEGIRAKIGRSANFIVLPVHYAHALKSQIKTYYDFDVLPINFRPVGVLKNTWRVYLSSHIGQDKVLIGYRGHHPADAGVVLSPESFFAHPKLKIIPKTSQDLKAKTGQKMWTLNFRGATLLTRPDYFRTIVVRPDKAEKNAEITFDL